MSKMSQFDRGERLELKDLIQIAETTVLSYLGDFIDKFIIGEDQAETLERGYVVRGFEVSVAGTVVTVAGGTAFLRYVNRGQLGAGGFVTATDSRSQDIGALGTATDYKVWLKLDLLPDDVENRIHWTPLAAPDPIEKPRMIPTTRLITWNFAVARNQPGDEYISIANIDKNGGTLTPTDLRSLFFESSPSEWAGALANSAWGTTDDRNAARGTYGLFSLRKFGMAVLKQMALMLDSTGGTPWPTLPSATSVDGGLKQKLSRAGGANSTVTGVIIPNGDVTTDFGSAAARFLTFYGKNVDLDALGDYKFETAKDGLRAIAVNGAQGDAANTLDHGFGPGTFVTVISGGAGAHVFYWNFDAPEGATLVEVEIDVFDLSNVTTAAEAELFRVDDTGAVVSISDAGAVTINSGVGTYSLPFAAATVFQPNLYAYFVQLTTASGDGSTVGISQIRLAFQYTVLRI